MEGEPGFIPNFGCPSLGGLARILFIEVDILPTPQNAETAVWCLEMQISLFVPIAFSHKTKSGQTRASTDRYGGWIYVAFAD